MDVERKKTQEAIIEGSEGRIGAAFSRLDLEQPDTDVDSQAEGPRVGDVVFGSELAHSYALAGADFFIDSAGGVS